MITIDVCGCKAYIPNESVYLSRILSLVPEALCPFWISLQKALLCLIGWYSQAFFAAPRLFNGDVHAGIMPKAYKGILDIHSIICMQEMLQASSLMIPKDFCRPIPEMSIKELWFRFGHLLSLLYGKFGSLDFIFSILFCRYHAKGNLFTRNSIHQRLFLFQTRVIY